MTGGLEHVHYVTFAYLAATAVILFLVLQSLFAAARAARALEATEKNKAQDKGDRA